MYRKVSLRWALIIGLTFSGVAFADLPNAPGKVTVVRVCGKCHSPEQASSLHQDQFGWEETITKMIKFGAQGSDDEFDTILAYLSKNFGPQKPGPININKATLVDLETTLLLRRHEARAIVEYRAKDGEFKSLDDLKNVPGLDFRKIEAKKDRVIF